MDPFGLTPEEEQRIAAETLRSQQVLGGAQQRGGRFDNLAAISRLANNNAGAEAAAAAQARAVARSKPAQLGNSGFMVDGQFAANPAAIQDKLEGRAQQRGLAFERANAAAEAQRQRLEAQAQQAGLNRDLRRDLANQSNALRQSLAAAKGGADEAVKVDKDLDKNTQKLAANLSKAAAPEFSEALSIALGALNKYDGKDIPGFGRLEGAIPNGFLGKEGQAMRADMAQAANILLKARSGAAVTESEMRRFLTEVGQGNWMDEETLRRGWANVERTFGEGTRNILSGFDDGVKSEYVKRGGTDFTTRPWQPKKASPTGGKPAPKGVDAALWNAMTPEEQGLWN